MQDPASASDDRSVEPDRFLRGIGRAFALMLGPQATLAALVDAVTASSTSIDAILGDSPEAASVMEAHLSECRARQLVTDELLDKVAAHGRAVAATKDALQSLDTEGHLPRDARWHEILLLCMIGPNRGEPEALKFANDFTVHVVSAVGLQQALQAEAAAACARLGIGADYARRLQEWKSLVSLEPQVPGH